MRHKQQKIKRVVWVEIKYGDDLLKIVSEFCAENNIKAGIVIAIGALQEARFGYYDQNEKRYCENVINEPVEIVSCIGNVSIKEGKPFVHAHISVGKKKGEIFGGHLNEGCVVFAAEYVIFELEGENIERRPDKLTGLSLIDFTF